MPVHRCESVTLNSLKLIIHKSMYWSSGCAFHDEFVAEAVDVVDNVDGGGWPLLGGDGALDVDPVADVEFLSSSS